MSENGDINILSQLKRIELAIAPTCFEMFGKRRAEHEPGCGREGDTSDVFSIAGKTFILLEVAGLPENGSGVLLLEGSINGRDWFELCQIATNGVYNLAATAQSQGLKSAGADEQAVARTLQSGGRISLNKLRGVIVTLPAQTDRISCFVLGTNQ